MNEKRLVCEIFVTDNGDGTNSYRTEVHGNNEEFTLGLMHAMEVLGSLDGKTGHEAALNIAIVMRAFELSEAAKRKARATA